jgi:putative transcriptional regulator
VIRHHPSEATLAAYASGVLPEALGVVVATHLFRCPVCRKLAAMTEAVGGSILDDLPPSEMDEGSLALVLARTERPAPPTPPVVRLEPGLPPPLDTLTFGRWRRVGLGLRWRPLVHSGTVMAGLLEGMPGRVLPMHGHTGLELTCVLDGSFADGAEHFASGDVAEVEGTESHRPTIVGDGPCLCMIATEGVRFRGLLGFAQRLLSD